jgi:HAD superfamily hydrolase (TIGR01509 family)
MLVLLDIGSTLIEGPPMGPGKRLVKHFGLDPEAAAALDRRLFQSPLGGPEQLAEFLNARCGVAWEAALQVSTELWQTQAQESWALPGAAEAIERLNRAGLARAYVSNIWAPFYRGFERLFPAEAHGQANFLSFRMGLSKPDPEFYRVVLDRMAIDPGQTVMVGDTYENDVAPALALGMKTVWVLHRPHKETRDLVRVLNRAAPAPDLTLESIGDLDTAVLERLLVPGPALGGR